MVDFSSPYLTEQLIAYIGNKRKLLPLVFRAIEKTGVALEGAKFFDVFAGSGAVSRLAKSLGCEVFSNDWEYYSYILNSAYVKIDKDEIPRLFDSEQKLARIIETINNLPDPSESEQYIARYYAPKSFDNDAADFKTERLFYTKRNAFAIDKIRNHIERAYPKSASPIEQKKRELLLAELLYEAATHTNTSGVFKAFHKGFGGYSKDALARITSPIRLRFPVLASSPFPVHVYNEDANALVKKIGGIDIAYVDPPYNQHQYGSNYHLLNTIALWDCIPHPLDLNEKGELAEKAGIRRDWSRTRSDYCYKEKAERAFADLLSNIDAKYILISYSTDGIIPFEAMRAMCMERGKVSIVTGEYTTYPGGKQSNARHNANIEFVFCIDTAQKSDAASKRAIDDVLMKKKFALLFKQKFSKEKLAAAAVRFDGKRFAFVVCGKTVSLRTDGGFVLYPPESDRSLSVSDLRVLYDAIFPCACKTKEDELTELLSHIDGSEKSRAFISRIPGTLKKLAHRKNRASFYAWLEKIKMLRETHPALYARIDKKIADVERLAGLRFAT